MSGATVYGGVIYGQSVGAGTITSASALASLQEENGTGWARVPIVLPASSSGIIAIPGWAVNPGSATNWHSTVYSAFIASALSGGVALFIWDLQAGGGFTPPADLSKQNANLEIPSVNWFVENPGGI